MKKHGKEKSEMKKYLGTIIAVTSLMGMYAAAHPHQAEHSETELESLCGGGPVSTAGEAGDVDKEAVCTRKPDCPVGAKKSEDGSRPWWQFWKR